MSSTNPPADPGFRVEISRGGRAADQPSPAAQPPRPLLASDQPNSKFKIQNSKFKTQSRVLGGVLLLALLIVAGFVAFAWASAQPPAGVLARVNGENITEAEVDREILVNRMLSALLLGAEETPGRAATVEDLIDRRMKAQDAARAGVTVSNSEVENFVRALIERGGKTPAELDEALRGYGLSSADFYASQRDVLLINSYIGLKVVSGAANEAARQQRINDWSKQLFNTSRIERFGIPHEPTAPKVGALAPDFKLRDLEGNIVTLTELRGRPLLLNFWATWCEPCRAELPALQATYERESAGGPQASLLVVGLATESDPDVVLSFQREYGLTFPLLPDEPGQIKRLYRVPGIPTSFFIDREGVIRAIELGSLDEKKLAERLKLIR